MQNTIKPILELLGHRLNSLQRRVDEQDHQIRLLGVRLGTNETDLLPDDFMADLEKMCAAPKTKKKPKKGTSK